MLEEVEVAPSEGFRIVRQSVDHAGAVIELPIRFGLAGKMTVPEATAGVARSSAGVATAPARALLIR